MYKIEILPFAKIRGTWQTTKQKLPDFLRTHSQPQFDFIIRISSLHLFSKKFWCVGAIICIKVRIDAEASGEIRISIHCYSFGSEVILSLWDFLKNEKWDQEKEIKVNHEMYDAGESIANGRRGEEMD